ncbi:MAG: hypothetical protein AB7S26_20755 [Sandaracinaceae bacterium]
MTEDRQRFLALLRGEVDAADARIAEGGGAGGASDRAWHLALRAARWHTDPASVAAPRLDECAALAADPEAREGLTQAAYQRARASALASDLDGLTEWANVLCRVDADAPETALVAGLAATLAPRSTIEVAGLEALRDRLAADSSLAIDLRSVLSLAYEVVGEPTHALAAAREASRLARDAELPQCAYLANLVLARQRRLHGLPHLAARILSALARVAPAQWGPWLGWELVMSGVIDAAEDAPDDSPVAALRRFLGVASATERATLTSLAGALRASAPASPFAADVSALLACTDPFDASDVAAEWTRGESDVPPRGLWGLSASLRPAAGTETALAVVAATPASARRVLWTGASVATHELGCALLPQSHRKQGRMDSTIAALCLAGRQGVADPELFHRVYQLKFAPHLHRGVLDVLLHRVRERVEGYAQIERADGRTAIRVARAMLVPDPRCGRPVDDRLLYYLATGGRADARTAARALDVPLRTAQAALQALVDDGSCVRRRHGNRVEYALEDTTFREPTRR